MLENVTYFGVHENTVLLKKDKVIQQYLDISLRYYFVELLYYLDEWAEFLSWS